MCQNFYSVDKNLFWFGPPRVKRGKGSAEGIEEQRNLTLKMVDSAELAVYEYLRPSATLRMNICKHQSKIWDPFRQGMFTKWILI